MEWISVKDKEPPKDGTKILVGYGWLNEWFTTSASYRTFHPNAQGKRTWRAEPSGNKINFQYWLPETALPEPPKDTPCT